MAMNTLVSNHLYTDQEYLALEEKAQVRHEFINGNLYEMPGGTIYHERVIKNIFKGLLALPSNQELELFFSGMRINVKESGNYYYPDVLVVSSSNADLRFYKDAVFLAEVLSPSTRTFDMVDKFIEYRKLPSLQYYMLVEPEYYHVTLHQKNAEGQWESDTFRKLTDSIPLPALGISLLLSELYKGMLWD
jgi:Uma2 family endonuclease